MTVHFTTSGGTGNRVGDIFLSVQGIPYHGVGVEPTLAVRYSHKLYNGGAPEFDFGSPINSVYSTPGSPLLGEIPT